MNFFFSSRRRHTFFFQAEDGIRDRSPSRGLGDVYKRQANFGSSLSLIGVEFEANSGIVCEFLLSGVASSVEGNVLLRSFSKVAHGSSESVVPSFVCGNSSLVGVN